jgi:competence protein ComGC
MKQRGMSLIEIMVLAIFACCIVLIAIPVITGNTSNNNTISWGINGMTESRCIEGYKFIVGQEGQARQILDEFGKGVRCENPNAGKPGSFGKM